MTLDQIQISIDDALRSAGISAKIVTRTDYDGTSTVEIVVPDAGHIEEVKRVLGNVVEESSVNLTIRTVWSIERVEDCQVAYGPNGSPRTAVLIPVVLRSGSTEVRVTVAITKLAEMQFEYILGNKPDFSKIATLVIENALKSGGASSWNPQEKDYFEVASNAVANLSRSLTKTA